MKNKAEGESAQITIVANATAEGIRMVAGQLAQANGVTAAQLRIAESYIEQFGKLAKAGNTMIIPADAANIAGMVATMTSIIKGQPQETFHVSADRK